MNQDSNNGINELPVIDAETASIRDCLAAIDRGGINMAIAVEGLDRFVGVVTDGDIRRAILAGADLGGRVRPVVNESPVTARHDESRSSILDLMQARSVAQVPVLNSEGNLIGVHTLSRLLGRSKRPNAAVVLAGGRGSRLGPITATLPKPMVEVAGRPILERIVNHLVGYGIEHIFLSIGYLGEVIERYFGDGGKHGCSISYLREDPVVPLGTGGPLGLLHQIVGPADHPVLVMNGDLLTQFDVGAFIDHHDQSSALASIAVTTHSYQVPFGVLAVDARGMVTSITEKPTRDEIVSAGMYVLHPALLSRVPLGVEFPITDIIQECISRGEDVTVWECDAGWIDIGRPQDLSKAQGVQ